MLLRLPKHATSFVASQIDEIYASDLPPPEKLHWALEHHAGSMMEHLDLVAVYLQEYRNLPPGRLQEAQVRKHYEQVRVQIVQDRFDAGYFRPVNVKR